MVVEDDTTATIMAELQEDIESAKVLREKEENEKAKAAWKISVLLDRYGSNDDSGRLTSTLLSARNDIFQGNYDSALATINGIVFTADDNGEDDND